MKKKKPDSRGVMHILEKGTIAQKRALFEFDSNMQPEIVLLKFKIWSRYFFPKFFQDKDAPFHDDMDMHRIRVYLGLDTVFLNIAFRGSAKTTRAKLFRAFAIACDTSHFRKYMRVLSKDPLNARQSVTDVYNMLTALSVKEIYPEIFEKTEAKREETMASFTTSTGIKMMSKSIGVDQRGAVQDEARPDFDWYDDFETRMSLYSAATTFVIWQNMGEAQTGLAKGGGSEYTCNYVSERGNVHKLVMKTEKRYLMIIPIAHKKDGHWVPTWNRFTRRDVEQMEKDEEEFEGERLSKPSAVKDVYFARDAIEKQKAIEPIDDIGGLRIFKKFNQENRVVLGSDVGGGVGLDSSTMTIIDLDCTPAQVIATYANNEIKPDAHATVVAKTGKKYGECYVAIEKNFGSTNDIFKTLYPTAKIHKTQRSADRIKFANATEYGWETNGSTKGQMMSDLCKAVEDGHIDLNDEGLIAEARSYTTSDLMDGEVDPRMTTRHFDLLMACAIAWHVRNFVRAPESKKSAAPFRGTNNWNPEKKKNPGR